MVIESRRRAKLKIPVIYPNTARTTALVLLCVSLAACSTREAGASSSEFPGDENFTETQGSPTNQPTTVPSVTSSADTISRCQDVIGRRELRDPYQRTSDQDRYTLSQEEYSGYLRLMGIGSLCLPEDFGVPFIIVDWNSADIPAAAGRMVSIGFEEQYGGGGWSSGYLIYATYDFSVGSEYEVFATQGDFEDIGAQTKPNMINIDGVEGFIRFHPGIPMGLQSVSKTYVFPFENYYVAAVQTLGAYEPAVIQEVLVEMEVGRHPDLMQEDVLMMDRLVSSIEFP